MALRALVGTLLLLPAVGEAQVPEVAPDSVDAATREEIRIRLEGPGVPPGERAFREGEAGPAAAGRTLQTPARLLRFYEPRAFAPAWSRGGAPTPAVEELSRAIRAAELEGLDPMDYHLAAVRSLLGQLRAAPGPAARAPLLADLDLLLSDAFFAYGAHLVAGRVDPVTLDPDWTGRPEEVELVPRLAGALAADRVEESLRDLVFAAHPGYLRLRSALATYRELDAGGGWPAVPVEDTLRLGVGGAAVAALRERLSRTGDLPAAGPTGDGAASDSFGSELNAAVKRFQRRHGLFEDGVVGPATLAALNVPARERVRQIELNLERWRWMPGDLGRRYILVNIAAFRVELMDSVETTLAMRAIVGRRYRKTPVFSDTVRYLVVNPSWNVPHFIAVNDKLPIIRRDPGYLARYGYRVYRGWGADEVRVDPDTVDWSRITARDFPYRLYQEPGPHNALGRIKFMFPNRFDVYLHDTPERELFQRTTRTFSSGCIRIEEPIELAIDLLGSDPSWSAERLDRVLASGRETTVPLPDPIPIHIQYWTAWTDPDGTVHFRPDIYDRDPGYLARYGYRVYRGWGADAARVDPDTVDWSRITARDFPYRLYQEPGPHNALGRIKFMFPNRFDVYLHDTPERELFQRTTRTFSSGCIRIEEPFELAVHLLRSDPSWSPDRLDRVLASGRETTVPLPDPIPIHIQYWTAWTDPDGTVHFRPDIYDRDEALEGALRSADG